MNSQSRRLGTKQPMVELARIARITHQLYERQQFAYVIVDHQWRVLEVSDNMGEFGFDQPRIKDDARSHLDFVVGLDSQTTLDLPLVLSPTNHPVHIVLLPEPKTLTIVIMDASREFDQQQLVQQKANENALLLHKQKRLMEELQTTQESLLHKNRALKEAGRLQSSFLSGVSHEFRTPLAAITGYADLLEQRLATQAYAKSMDQLEAISRASRHLLSLVENLLDHGKFDSGEIVINPRQVDTQLLVDDIEAILRPLAATKQIEFNVSVTPSPLPNCLLDDTRVRQIILNVAGNAIKFTDHGSVDLKVGVEGDCLIVEIIDTGVGINKSDLEKTRQPFWQAAGSGKIGTGLGLTITDRIVELLGGSLTLDSQLGVGTHAFISLPTMVMDKLDEQERKAKNEALKPMRFLLVEDDPDIAALLTVLLEEKQVEVIKAVNGQQAIERAAETTFDLILMDLQLPIMDGYQASSALRKAGDKTPILVMTASSLDADRTRAEQSGCDGYLIKPVDVNELLNVAKQLVHA